MYISVGRNRRVTFRIRASPRSSIAHLCFAFSVYVL